MTIVTRKRADKFAIIPNAVAEDYRLSFEARGLLCYLLAKPNDWRVEVSDIMQSGGIGRDKAYRLLKELRETGYIELVQKRNAFNHITEHQYVVYDRAVPSEFLLPEKPEVDNPLTENTEVGKPLPENPDAGKPDAGKPDGVLRTKRNQIPKTSPYPQQGERKDLDLVN
ncbi:helix-turn-helix domain-containing protein [Mesorhizobium huakuii]|uniref:Helix-turn-helix domain-containing protein n=1 Tax=Mesorhizobium huakuii TaxID=28104 RepID=A0A7G6T0T2_9HYPH|nr:helix-turn-helix domain-containing protein [Mesorhizobium huakuii]QND60364.1 helix-turn-helix domain-containing protein [Mesorhizobium huakuii]